MLLIRNGDIWISVVRGISLRRIKELESLLVFIHTDFKNLHRLGNFRMSF